MIYRVYTDAATKLQEGYSSVAFLVLQGNTYIKSHKSIYYEDNTSIAESIALSLALEYTSNELDVKEEDEVIVFCDSIYTIKFARKCQKMYKSKDANNTICFRPSNAYWLEGIYDSIPKIKGNLTFKKVKAHSKGKNPHCYVDRLAKSGLQID